MLSRGPLRLMLNAVGGSGGASQPMPDGRVPEPGGWARFQLIVDDLDAEVERLRSSGATFRNDIVRGIGGNQVLLEDPSGNVDRAVPTPQALSTPGHVFGRRTPR